MQTPDDALWELLAAHVTGQPLTDAQRQRLLHWQQTDPNAPDVLRQMRQCWSRPAASFLNPEAAFARLDQRLRNE